MEQKELIAQIYKILLLYEDVYNGQSSVCENDYLGYLDRMYVYWVGNGNSEIFNIIKGLYSLGMTVEHKTVKSMVFHMISVLQKEGVGYGL